MLDRKLVAAVKAHLTDGVTTKRHNAISTYAPYWYSLIIVVVVTMMSITVTLIAPRKTQGRGLIVLALRIILLPRIIWRADRTTIVTIPITFNILAIVTIAITLAEYLVGFRLIGVSYKRRKRNNSKRCNPDKMERSIRHNLSPVAPKFRH
ncbi:MAG: hypothetical protein ACOH12_06770 [Parvibaculaceae bacterium]